LARLRYACGTAKNSKNIGKRGLGTTGTPLLPSPQEKHFQAFHRFSDTCLASLNRNSPNSRRSIENRKSKIKNAIRQTFNYSGPTFI
jgi:hypothetical protein